LNRKLINIIVFACITIFLISVCFVAVEPVQAAGTVDIVNATDGTSNFNFTTAQKNVGDTIVINITINGAVNLASWQVGIQWDQTMLGYVSMIAPTDNVFTGKNPIFAGPDASVAGLVVYGASVGTGQTGFTGNGRMAQLTLNITQAPGQGQTLQSDIIFEGILFDTFLLDALGNDITNAFTFNNAHFQYTGPAGPALTHDVAVTNVVPASTSVTQGNPLNISVTIANNGNFTETFNVGITGNGASVAPNQTASNLASGASTTLTFTWDTNSSSPGTYNIVGIAGPVTGETNTADNTKSGGTVRVQAVGAGHDIAVIEVVPANTAIGQGLMLNVNVTVINNGNSAETFDVSIFANSTQAADNQTVPNLDAGKNVTLLFQWNTTGWTVSNYTLSGVAGPVAGETFTSDNTLVFGNIYVMLPGDGNNDGIVNFKDLLDLLTSHAFNAFKGGSRYNPYMDMNASGRIDMRDILIIVLNFNKHL
jgi:hypothetical protein